MKNGTTGWTKIEDPIPGERQELAAGLISFLYTDGDQALAITESLGYSTPCAAGAAG
jgi:hypothetical protein